MSTKRRSRRRIKSDLARGQRPRLAIEMEEFLAGGDSVFRCQSLDSGTLLSNLSAERYFALHIEEMQFEAHEVERLDRLEAHYRAVRAVEDDKRFGEIAQSCGFLDAYKSNRSKGNAPKIAFREANPWMNQENNKREP